MKTIEEILTHAPDCEKDQTPNKKEIDELESHISLGEVSFRSNKERRKTARIAFENTNLGFPLDSNQVTKQINLLASNKKGGKTRLSHI